MFSVVRGRTRGGQDEREGRDGQSGEDKEEGEEEEEKEKRRRTEQQTSLSLRTQEGQRQNGGKVPVPPTVGCECQNAGSPG